MRNYVDFGVLLNKVIVEVKGLDEGSEEVVFVCDDGSEYRMYHEQDCCESVYIADVCGDVSDLRDALVVEADERSEDAGAMEYGDTGTWTFYHLTTTKGTVVIRWLGTSNGYYSESVSFVQVAGE